jgi:hypothetical protein
VLVAKSLANAGSMASQMRVQMTLPKPAMPSRPNREA